MKKIFEILLFTALCFFPMIKIGDFSVPTLLFFLPFVFFMKPSIDRKNFKCILLITAIFLPIYLSGLLLNQSLSMKDLLFALYPFLMFAVDFLLLNIIGEKAAIKFLKFFIIIQLIFCIMQALNIANTNSLLANVYEYWQEANYQKTGLWELSARPFGTVGSPIFVSVISYIFAKVIQRKTGSNVFVILSLLITLFAGARVPLVTIVCVEIFDKLIFSRISLKRKIMFAIVMVLLLLLAINVFPFIRDFFEYYIVGDGDLTKNYSFTYRQSMFNMLVDNSDYLMMGGYGINNFPVYVDNEYILRLLQFGLLNFLLILAQYFYLYKEAWKRMDKKTILIEIFIFIGVCMLSANILTNIFLIQYIILSLGLIGDRYCYAYKDKENCLKYDVTKNSKKMVGEGATI